MSVTGFNRRRRLEAKRKAREEKNKQSQEEIDWEEEVKQYHTGSGWYELPGYEKALRKDDAIKALKGE